MRYALLICTEEKRQAELSEEEAAAQTAAYMTWGEEMTGRGLLRGGERLQPIANATTVRVRDGEVLTSDGPFAETKEQLGGFFLLECEDLDEALEAAARLPGAAHGSIEVRPLWEM
jgi:hypothetical protein